MTADHAREVVALRRLHELMCQVNAGDDLAAVLQSLVDGVADVTGFAVAAVSYLHPDRHLEVLAVAGDDTAREQLLGIRTPLDAIIDEFGLADDWGMLKFIPHERLGGVTPRGWIPAVAVTDAPDAWHPEDALLAPLYAPTGEMVGLLSVDVPLDGRRPGRFAVDALEMYAAQAGIAISNAQQRERLREKVRLSGTVRDVIQTAGDALDLGRVIDGSVAPLVGGMGLAGLWIRAFEGEGELPGRRRGAIHPPSAPIPTDELLSMTRRWAEGCWARRRALVLPPPDEDCAWVDEDDAATALHYVSATGSRTVLIVPMGAGRECLGYLALGRDADPSAWTTEEITASLEVGRDLGRAVLHARLYERERELVEELRRVDHYKTEMVSTLAHELKNPLTSIVGHLELLEALDRDPQTTRSVAAIDRGARRLSALVDDLMVLSKVGDPSRAFVPEPVDLARLVEATAEMLEAAASRQRVRIILEGTTEKVATWGVAAELDRLVSNLLSNAVKFSPEGGAVTCSLRTGPEGVVLRCRDEGIGISEADRALLFTEFFRSSNPTAQEIPGTGLGLTIVKRIVERHAGSITVDSTLGQGSTFTVTLPAVTSEARLSGVSYDWPEGPGSPA